MLSPRSVRYDIERAEEREVIRFVVEVMQPVMARPAVNTDCGVGMYILD
jgi:hypothetical protein